MNTKDKSQYKDEPIHQIVNPCIDKCINRFTKSDLNKSNLKFVKILDELSLKIKI